MEARQHSEQADLHLIPMMKLEYYLNLKDRYRRMITTEVPKLPEKPGGPVLDSGSQDAKIALFSVARQMKRSLGYGERR